MREIEMQPDKEPTPAQRHFHAKSENLAEKHREGTARRLGYLALAMAIYSLMGVGSAALPGAAKYLTPQLQSIINWTAAIFCVLSVGLFILTRLKIDAQRKLDIGLVYQVIGSYLWALGEVDSLPAKLNSIFGISFIVLWVTVFPIVAPSTFLKSFIANILAGFTLVFAYLTLPYFFEITTNMELIIIHTGPVASVALLAMVPVYFHNKIGKDLERADKMGSYELVTKLGEGGMGEVWKARHNLLASSSAIKLIKPEMILQSSGDSNPDLAVRRFEREARATAALKSPNTINLYDFGQSESGICYYVMELLDGMDLGALVDRFGPIEPGRAIELLKQICYSLIEAHEVGMVHRDIKPANIYLCRMKTHFDVVKVLDFGLVKRSMLPSQETKLTMDGMITGTPAFIAPELAKGEKEIDGRADIYAVGCVAYWLLTAKHVFDEDTPMKIILGHLSQAPVPPSKRTELEIPEAFEQVILKCLEKDPDQRPQSARELEKMLASIELDSKWGRARAEHWWQKNMPESPD
jgi:eukaryotic-like serine/threonine-protein kinase